MKANVKMRRIDEANASSGTRSCGLAAVRLAAVRLAVVAVWLTVAGGAVALQAEAWAQAPVREGEEREAGGEVTGEAAGEVTGEAAGDSADDDVRGAGDGRAKKVDAGLLDFYLLTMGPGDELFSRYGHNAILVTGHPDGQARVFNFGTFSPGDPQLIQKFLQGRLTYWLSVFSWGDTVGFYRHFDRTMVRQALNLTREEKVVLAKALDRWLRPENATYLYHFFENNCSTKVRDVLDEALGGKLRATYGGAVAKRTLRDHIVLVNGDTWPVAAGIYLVMNSEVDVALTAWDEMFLPLEMKRHLDGFAVGEASGGEGGGGRRPLLGKVDTIVSRAGAPRGGVSPWGWFHGVVTVPMLVFLGVMAWLSVRKSGLLVGDRWVHWLARMAVGKVTLLWGFLAGALGLAMSGFWLLSDHRNTHHNENLFLFPPTHLLLVVAGVALMRRPKVGAGATAGASGSRVLRLTENYLALHALVVLLYALVNATGLLPQHTLHMQALSLPVTVLTWVIVRSRLAADARA